MEGPIRQLYEKDGAEFKPIRACDCENQGGNGGNNDNDDNGGGNGGGDNNGGGGGLPTNISAVASAYESNTVEADASVNPETGVFAFNFGIPRGRDGRDGKDGKDGKDGVDGITPVAHKSVMVFKTHVSSMSKPEPDKPVGGSWNPISGNIAYPDGWGPTDNVEKPVWMATGEFSSASPNNPTWSKPICISGEDGSNGTDGTTREYVYQLTKSSIEPPQPAGSEIPSPNENGYVPTQYGWTASPTGISEGMRAEWVLTRKKRDDGSWGYWEGPVLWSSWGVNGQDGDGVEYIYKVGGLGGFENPTPKYSNGTFNIYAEGYQDDEYHAKEQGWTDNPTGVSISNPCEWVCVRKQKNGVWQAFSDPALWAKYSENGYDGTSIRTKYTVTENSSVKPKIDYPNSKDPGSRWTYAVPSYSGDEALWSIWTYMDRKGELISFTVTENGKDKVISGWQGPCIMSGSQGDPGNPVNYKTTVFALSSSRPNKPTNDDPNNVAPTYNANGELVDWVDYPNQTPSDNLQWWQCIGVVDGLTERIMTDSEGKLMWGVVLNVHGKDGIAQDGKVYEFRFKAYSKQILENVDEILPDNQRTVREPSGWFLGSEMPQINAENPFMWEIVGLINPDGTLSGRWSDPFCVTGERGPKGETGPAGPVGPEGPQGISGIPGKHIEAWYCLGTDIKYDAKYDDEVAYDIDPSEHGWLGYCPKPTNEKPFIWCIQGSVIYVRTNDENNPFNKILEGFNGKQGKWSEPFKTNAVSVKGVGIETVREYYLVTERSQGVTLNSNDSDINNWVLNKIPAFTPKKIYLWNYEVIVYEDGRTGNPTAPAILTRQGADGKGILSITEKYAAWDKADSYPEPTSDVWKSAGEAKVSESKPYLWNWEHIEYTEGKPDDFFNVIGAMGAPGPAGRAGQIIYPAGVYSPNTTYITTDKKAPYVYDTQYKQYYVLNYIGSWRGHSDDPNLPETSQNRTPGEDFEINKGKYWLKFESFDAIFANIGIIANGLIGSSVFNGEFMFSQQGINKAGSPSTNYENFCDSYAESYNGSRDPYNINNSFKPNWCVNFATGEQWLGAGKIYFGHDGSGHVANGAIAWDANGNVKKYPKATASISATGNSLQTQINATAYVNSQFGDTSDSVIQVCSSNDTILLSKDVTFSNNKATANFEYSPTSGKTFPSNCIVKLIIDGAVVASCNVIFDKVTPIIGTNSVLTIKLDGNYKNAAVWLHSTAYRDLSEGEDVFEQITNDNGIVTIMWNSSEGIQVNGPNAGDITNIGAGDRLYVYTSVNPNQYIRELRLAEQNQVITIV